MKVRHCPQCQTDYRPEIIHCVDCAQLLEDRDEETDVFGASSMACFADHEEKRSYEGFEPFCRAGDVRDLVPLADRLASKDVGFFIDELRKCGRCLGFRIYVRVEERQHALDELAPLLESGTFSVVLERSLEDSEEAENITHCPACGGALPESVFCCLECGLPFRESEPRCPACAAPISDEEPRCGNCGMALDS